MKASRVKSYIISIGIVLSLITISLIGIFGFEGLIIRENAKAKSIIVDVNGSGSYTSIQSAIDNAQSGDTIYVWAGEYHENIIIEKEIKLIANSSENTTITGMAYGSVIYISANNVVVSGFTIVGIYLEGAHTGIFLNWTSGCRIINNTISDCSHGIDIYTNYYNYIINNTFIWNGVAINNEGYRTQILNNIFIHNGIGVEIWDANVNTIKNNVFKWNSYGIWLGYSWLNTISNNTIIGSIYDGIFLNWNCNGNIISDNLIKFSGEMGIYVCVSYSNKILNNTLKSCGIYITGCDLYDWISNTVDSKNTVNGRPVYFIKNQTNKQALSNVGQAILINCQNITIKNQNISNASVGIQLVQSGNITIEKNTFNSNNYISIQLKNSNYNKIINNTFTDGGDCITGGGSNNKILNNFFYNNKQYYNDGYCIYLYEGINNTIIDNNFSNNLAGIYLRGKNIRIINNTCIYNKNVGFNIGVSQSTQIKNNNCSNNSIGIFLNGCQYSTIINNTCNGNSYDGISSWGTFKYNKVLNNSFSNNKENGIFIEDTVYSELSNNICDNNSKNGIVLQTNTWWGKTSDTNTIANNSCKYNSENGIKLIDTYSTTLKNNNMISCGLLIEGDEINHWNTHTIDKKNEVNGKILYYLKNKNSGTISQNAGQVILANCKNVVVKDQNLSCNSVGITLAFSDKNNILNNSCNRNIFDGIYLYKSNQNSINNNTINSNKNNGIFLKHGSNSNTIKNNICNFNLKAGLSLEGSNNNEISSNYCNGNSYEGIFLHSSDQNTIINNNCSQNIDGVRVQYSESNVLKNNTMFSCGLYLNGYYSTWNSQIIHNNLVNNKPIYYIKDETNMKVPSNAGQIIMVNCSNLAISNQNLSYGSEGILIINSNNISIKNTVCNYNSHNGIRIYTSKNNLIEKTICNYNLGENRYYWYNEGGNGLYLVSSDSNKIINSVFQSNTFNGIQLSGSNSNEITNNSLFKNCYGISISDSTSNKITNNTLNFCGITLTGYKLKHLDTHVIEITNIINGKPVYYWTHQNNRILPSGAGQVILINCSRIAIKNQNLSYGTIGIELIYCESIEIKDNTINFNNKYGIYSIISNNNSIYNNEFSFSGEDGIYLAMCKLNTLVSNICNHNSNHGIFLDASAHHVIENNTLSNNYMGIEFLGYGESMRNFEYSKTKIGRRDELPRYASFNKFANNICWRNYYGIVIDVSYYNDVYLNNICNNDFGIALFGDRYNEPIGNMFYWNNIISNKNQAKDFGSNGWSYKGQGNYWSDYKGQDNGAFDRIKGDDIGDTHIPHLGLDYFPFINPINFTLPPNSPLLIDPGINDSDGNYTLTWHECYSSIGYILEEDTNENFNSPIIIYNGSGSSIDIKLKANGTYYYHVKAYNKYGESNWSNIVDIIVDWPPDVPKNFTVLQYPLGNTLNLSWALNHVDTKIYQIFSNFTGNWSILSNMSSTQHLFNHTELIDGQTYYYRIQAQDARGQVSNLSEIASGTPYDSIAPAPPTGLKVIKTTNDSISLSWIPNAEEDLEGYNIYRSNTSNPETWGEPIGTIGDEEFIDMGLEELKIYYYVICAFDEVPNKSGFSNLVQGTTILGPHGPVINNSIDDFEIVEDTIDDTPFNLYHWFKDPNNDPLQFRCVGQRHLNVTIHHQTGTVTLIPKKNWNGQETLTFYANNSVLEIFDDVTITVTPVNDPPGPAFIIEPLDGLKVENGTGINFSAICDDPDLPYGDKLTFMWTFNISNEFWKGQNLTNVFLIPGNHSITLTVIDLIGKTSMAMVNITIVSEINVSPNQTQPENDTSPEIKKEGNFTLKIIGMIIVIIIIIIILFMVLKKKRIPDIDKDKEKQFPHTEPVTKKNIEYNKQITSPPLARPIITPITHKVPRAKPVPRLPPPKASVIKPNLNETVNKLQITNQNNFNLK